jgi:hypothetical protein
MDRVGYPGGNGLKITNKESTGAHVALVIALTALTVYLLFRHIRARRDIAR